MADKHLQVNIDGSLESRQTVLWPVSKLEQEAIIRSLFEQDHWSVSLLEHVNGCEWKLICNSSTGDTYKIKLFISSIRDESRKDDEFKMQLGSKNYPCGSTIEGWIELVLGIYVIQQSGISPNYILSGYDISSYSFSTNPSIRGTRTKGLQRGYIYGMYQTEKSVIFRPDFLYFYIDTIVNQSKTDISIPSDDVYSIEDIESEGANYITPYKEQVYIDLLKSKKNIVLTGAPGTGKTFLSKAVAAHIIGATSWDELTPEQKEHVGFVQFHPSYDYTDFVEGLRPAKDGNFIRQDGVFKAFCKKAITSKTFNLKAEWDNLLADVDSGAIAELTNKSGGKVTGLCVKNGHLRWEDSNGNIASNGMSYKQLEVMYRKFSDTLPEKVDDLTPTGINTQLWAVLNEIHKRRDSRTSNDDPFVFIIDEINRGELSKIFGELFYSIEPDYRGESGRVRTQYNNMVEEGDVFAEGFYIPENVYIIGTMNDVDRGVEAMDFAIRRRFAWAEVTAKESAENMGITGLAAKKMEALNKALESQGLSSAYHIGGAYFRKLEGDDYKSLWEYHLKGIISEYFRGEPDYETKIKEIEDAYNSVVETAATDSTDIQDGAEPTESAETGNSEE